jgi:hypothetical protein
VTLVATTTSPWGLSRDELERITYLFSAEYTMKKVRNMPKREFVFNRKKIREDIAARAMLREDVEISQENKVQLKCVDMGYRSLNRLQDLHGELCILDPGLADKQDSTAEYPVLREPWEKSHSRIISAAELEGGVVPKVAVASKTAPKPVPKAASTKPVPKVAFATERSDVNKFILRRLKYTVTKPVPFCMNKDPEYEADYLNRSNHGRKNKQKVMKNGCNKFGGNMRLPLPPHLTQSMQPQLQQLTWVLIRKHQLARL